MYSTFTKISNVFFVYESRYAITVVEDRTRRTFAQLILRPLRETD